MLPQEVFLSYSEKDHSFASLLAETIRRHGIPVWYSRTNVIGAQQWHDEIGSALKRCDWFVVVLSPHSVTSKWVKRELLFALNDQKYENRIVPLLYQDCDYDQLSWTLSLLQFVSFKDNHEVGYRDLLRIWGLGYQS